MPVLVTGGLGFMGASAACRLVDIGANVSVVDAMLPNQGGNPANIAGYEDRIKVSNADLRRREDIPALVAGKQAIFNFAGQVSHLDSMNDPVGDMEANVLAQINLLEACRKHAPQATIVFASTRQIYGKPDMLPVNENHPLRPVDVNGVNKMAGEAFHILYHNVYGLRTVALRFTNTYGPRMRVKDARQTFLGVWLRAVVEGKTFEVWGGEQLRDLAYIDDAVSACLAAATTPEAAGKPYNIGGSPPLSLVALAEMLVKTAGSGGFEIKQFPQERKRIDIGDYYADDRQFRAVTGWAPEVSLQEGLARSFAYYRERLKLYV